jgi:hypothetical protein
MRRRSAKTAVLAVLLLVVGQLFGFAHEAGTRHVTCPVHGEQLEAPTLASSVHECGDSHVVGVEGGGEHEDCAIARAIHQSTQTSTGPTLTHVAALALVFDQPAPTVTTVTSDLYRLAPKTSPPL